MAKRTKKRIVVPPSKAEVGDVMKSFAEASSKIKEMEAQEELALTQVREQFANQAKELVSQKQEALEKLEAFGIGHKDELFKGKRSMDLHHGVIGFRLGTPKVDKPRTITWGKVIEGLKENNSPYLRTKLEVDKDSIIANREDATKMAELKEYGISVVQEETFFVSIKEGDLEKMNFAVS